MKKKKQSGEIIIQGKPVGRPFVSSDIMEGEVISFYNAGWRYAKVTKIQIPTRKSKKATVYVHTDRYGKVPLSKVDEVYMYNKEGKTVKKDYLDTFEGLFE